MTKEPISLIENELLGLMDWAAENGARIQLVALKDGQECRYEFADSISASALRRANLYFAAKWFPR